ncbi:hypothetical protein HMPREF0202_01356 [Cetobacterium somerae ATCC BAA-474]|uniref:Uncharacterized protein n=1 Tax=Cetobacterium somerae ATCC BAA-474 TaxID=1319815 RepID=U7VAL7_9FUSO|nr:hypothetical protein HMPREF0202_01356 [Cetobacterium somerae ATCC BAA-474]
MNIVNLIKKHWKEFFLITIIIFILNLIEVKFFNKIFSWWEALKIIIISFIVSLNLKKK